MHLISTTTVLRASCSVLLQADLTGRASAFYTVRPGPNSVNVLGRTFVVHDGDVANTRIACGVVQLLDLVQVKYELEGVEALRFGKIAVHEGKSCTNAGSIGNPYKNLNLFGTNTDPWGMEYGVGFDSCSFVRSFFYQCFCFYFENVFRLIDILTYISTTGSTTCAGDHDQWHRRRCFPRRVRPIVGQHERSSGRRLRHGGYQDWLWAINTRVPYQRGIPLPTTHSRWHSCPHGCLVRGRGRAFLQRRHGRHLGAVHVHHR
jgi:hypothetical protein